MAGVEIEPIDKYVLNRYQEQINYYWMASTINKKAYKRFRTWSIMLGTLVTVLSSLSTADFVQSNEQLRIMFAIMTPVIAATFTIMIGLGQTFRWDATWRDMVMNAMRLERERDRFLATPPEERDLRKELDVLSSIALDETKDFFAKRL